MIEKQEVQEIFPTPLWVVDLQPAAAVALNAKLKTEIERLIEPGPRFPPAATGRRRRISTPNPLSPSS